MSEAAWEGRPAAGGVADELRAAGCVAAEDEADELVAAAGEDGVRLRELVERRCAGEPLAWLTGSVRFCGEPVVVHPGVYVPRWQSEPMALEAARRLPPAGCAVDLCTGSGAIAVVLARRRPHARVLATEVDPLAAACARANGVEVLECDLAAGLPEGLAGELGGRVDVVSAVVPYVPTGALRLLPRDVLAFEPRHALDGGPTGMRLLEAAAGAAARLLCPGGSLLVELGGDQADELTPWLGSADWRELVVARDEDGDVRALYARRADRRRRRPPDR